MKKQAGFSALLAIIITGILGVTTLMAVDSYSDYTQRAVISTGIQLSDDLKKAVSVYLASTGSFPQSNDDIEMPDGETLSDGDRLILVPSIVGNRVKWYCTSDTIITDLLPDGCTS